MTAASGASPRLRRRQADAAKVPTILMASLIIVMLLGGALVALFAGRQEVVTPGSLRAAGSVHVPTQRSLLGASPRALLGLVSEPHRRAPDFSLLNASGEHVSLTGLWRSHAVVLMFVNPQCRDVCPVLTKEVALAQRNLGTAAARVAFVAVDVNVTRSSAADAAAFLRAERLRLGLRSNFELLVGSPARLRAAWADYGVSVQVEPNGGIVHSEALYFIAPGGVLRYRATPFANETRRGVGSLPASLVAEWGRGIAHFALATLK